MLTRRLALVLFACLLAPAVALAAGGNVPPDKRPAFAFQKFLKVARTTDSAEDLLPYLSDQETRRIQTAQDNYDPEANREALADVDGFSADLAAQILAKSPYEYAVTSYRTFATRVKKYPRTEIDGDIAIIYMKSSPGHKMVDATATMKLEQGQWKLDDYEVDISGLFD